MKQASGKAKKPNTDKSRKQKHNKTSRPTKKAPPKAADSEQTSSTTLHPESFHQTIELSEAERHSQTKMILRLFDKWKLSPIQQAICLGLSTNSRTTLAKYRRGEACLPLHRDIQDRVTHLFAIHAALRTLFPENDLIAYSWINRRNKHFDNHTPLEIICRDNFQGILTVRHYLEQALTV